MFSPQPAPFPHITVTFNSLRLVLYKLVPSFSSEIFSAIFDLSAAPGVCWGQKQILSTESNLRCTLNEVYADITGIVRMGADTFYVAFHITVLDLSDAKWNDFPRIS